MVKRSGQTYPYRESGLDNVVLVNVDGWVCPACGEEIVELPAIKALHKIIGHAIVQKDVKLTGREIRFLRKDLGLMSSEFARLLGYSPETVSRIERDRHEISNQGDRLVRSVYAMRRLREEIGEAAESLLTRFGGIAEGTPSGEGPLEINLTDLLIHRGR